MGNLWSGISPDSTRGTLTRIDPWAWATVGYSDLRRTASTAVRASLRSCRTAAGADRLRSDIQHRPSPAGGSSYICSMFCRVVKFEPSVAWRVIFGFVHDGITCTCTISQPRKPAFCKSLEVKVPQHATRRSHEMLHSLNNIWKSQKTRQIMA